MSRDAKGPQIITAKMKKKAEEEAARAAQRAAFEKRQAKMKAEKKAKGESTEPRGLKDTKAKAKAKVCLLISLIVDRIRSFGMQFLLGLTFRMSFEKDS
jgi:hypothetical protein